MEFSNVLQKCLSVVLCCMLFGTSQLKASEFTINIAVLTDEWEEDGKQSCNIPEHEELRAHATDGIRITGYVSWYHKDTPFDLLMKAHQMPGNDVDVVVIDSHRQVYNTLKYQISSENFHVVHWPSKDVFEYGVPENILLQRCICDVHFGHQPERENCTELNEKRTGEKYSRNFVVASLISEIQTDSLFVIFQNDRNAGLQFKASELDQFNLKLIVYDTDALQTEEQIMAMLIEATAIMKRDGVQFLLICDEPCIERILRTANGFDQRMGYATAIHQLSRWLVFADENLKEVTKEATRGLDNVAFVSLISEEQKIPCPKKVMLNIFQSALFQVGCIKASSPVNEDSGSFFANILKIYRESIQKHGMEYKVETLMWKQENQRAFEVVGSITGYGDKKLNSKMLFPNINYGFNSRTFSVASLEWPPFTYRKEKNGTIEYEGYSIEMLKELSSVLNFSYTFTEPKDGQWGMPGENNSWTGLVGMLQKREVDMVMAPLSMDARREGVIDFSHPYYYEYTTGLMKKPDPLKKKWRTIINPFTWQVHITILCILPVSSFLLCLLERLNPYYLKNTKHQPTGRNRLSTFYDAVWYMTGLTVFQGGVNLPKSLTGRTMLSFCWLYSIIMVALYSGNLIAFLTVTKDSPPFSKINELVQQDTYKWGTLNGTIWMVLFKYSDVDSLKAVWNGIERFVQDDTSILSGDNQAHIDKVRAGDYVYIADQTQFEQLTYTDCELVIMDEKFYPNNYAVALQNNSPYKDIFSERVMTITESGLPGMWKQKWWPRNKFCDADLKTESKAIHVVDIQSAFYLLLIGIFCAVVALLFEMCLDKMRSAKQRNGSQTS